MNSALSIQKSQVLYYAGCKDGADNFDGKIDRAIELCLKTAAPKHVIKPFDLAGDYLLGGTAYSLEGGDIRAYFEGCKKVFVIAATLGYGVDLETDRLFVSDPLLALLYDSAASACIENYLDLVLDGYAQGLRRFSCGYGDFPLSANKKLAAILSAEKLIGLKVSGEFLLSPKKSVIAVAGGGGPTLCDNKCKNCSLKSCIYRKN